MWTKDIILSRGGTGLLTQLRLFLSWGAEQNTARLVCRLDLTSSLGLFPLMTLGKALTVFQLLLRPKVKEVNDNYHPT